MSFWNHRVVRRTHPPVLKKGKVIASAYVEYAIHEAYYPSDEEPTGKPDSITEEAVEPSGETLKELKNDLERMLRATKKPVLDYETRDEVAPMGCGGRRRFLIDGSG